MNTTYKRMQKERIH